MPVSRAFIVSKALMMDRIVSGSYARKTGNADSGDTFAAGVTLNMRRVRPSYSMILANPAMYATGSAVWQVIDEPGTLAPETMVGGKITVAGIDWYIQLADPTAGEVLILCSCTRGR